MKKNILRITTVVMTSLMLMTGMASESKAINRNGGYSQNDVRVKSGLTKEEISQLLPYRMKELSEPLYNIENSDKPINALFLMSLMRLETGNGTSYSYRIKNNVGGVMGRNGTRYFNSKSECLYYMQDFLNRGYINQGRISVWTIGSKYCVGGNWASKVNRISINNMYRSWSL